MRANFFFYINKDKKKRFRRTVITTLICISMSLSVYITKEHIYPVANAMAKSIASQKIMLIMNKEVLDLIKKEDISYQDIIDIKRAENGEIVSLETNTANVNKIKSTLAYDIQKSVSNITNTDIGIPIGNLFRSIIFTGRGPKIPVKLTSVGDISVDICDEFIAAGINQTKHKIDIDVSMSVTIVLPDSIDDVEVKTRVPVAETVIVGKVPVMYMGK